MRFLKTGFSLIVSLIFTSAILSQEPVNKPIKSLAVGNKWFYQSSGSFSHFGGSTNKFYYQSINDTLINNIHFYHLKKKNTHRIGNIGGDGLPTECYEAADSNKLLSLLLEDNSKIEEMYDFSLSVGDTIYNEVDTSGYYDYTPYFCITYKGDTTIWDNTCRYIKIHSFSKYYSQTEWSKSTKVTILESLGYLDIEHSTGDYQYKAKLEGVIIDGNIIGDTTTTFKWLKSIDTLIENNMIKIVFEFDQSIDVQSMINGGLIINSKFIGKLAIDHITSISSNKYEVHFVPPLLDGDELTITLTKNLKNTEGLNISHPSSKKIKLPGRAGTGQFVDGETIEIPKQPLDFSVGDYDLDNDLDLVTVTGEEIYFIKHQSDENLQLNGKINICLTQLQLIDLDLDGDLDISACHNTGSIVTTLINQDIGSALFIVDKYTSIYTYIRAQLNLDMNNDAIPDIVTAYNKDRQMVVVRISPNDYPFFHYYYPDSWSPFLLYSGDYNNDGIFDIAFNSPDSSYLNFRLNDGRGDFEFGRGDLIQNTHYSRHLSNIDMDKDGDIDIIFSSGIICYNNGHGNFNHRSYFPFSGTTICAGDFNADGFIDIAGTQDLKLITFLNDGENHFIDQFHTDLPDKVFKLETADINKDGSLDLIAMYYSKKNIDIYYNRLCSNLISATRNNESSGGLILYPNPFNNRINIVFNKTPEIQSIRIYDIKGRCISKENYELHHEYANHYSLNMIDLTSGIYILRIKTGNNYCSKKVTLLR